ncbi:MAG TPA: M20/M25/M40 family metallo-hydrolase [Gaiellaceae bacterium]|nr:M20/M25/M40 family metallo-hydrolase [Gaiellaceae bacterium]
MTGLLQGLLRLNTVNPPGNETAAAELLRAYLASNGVPCELVARSPERANLVARLPGGDGPTLAFLCHTDTVLADPVEWERDPWGGELVDGELWGRGALDMKDQVAASAVAFASLWREGFQPPGDLLFIATADEEVGDGFGLQWLAEEHPDRVRVDFCLNEGGGERLVLGGAPYYLCGTAEKMSAPFRLRLHGRSGHASAPGIADNALVWAARAIDPLARLAPPVELIPEVRRFLEVTLGEVPPPAMALGRARAFDPLAAELVEPLLSFTLSPTMIEASRQRNVIPAICDVDVDCRILPGRGPADVEPLVRAALLEAGLGPERYELEWLGPTGGTRSELDTPLWRALEGFVGEAEPAARLVPICNAGFTDSHWLREAFGTVAYGFFPMRTMSAELAARLIHSADERVVVDDLELGVLALRYAAKALE